MRERVSQKTVYNTTKILNDFFRWAKRSHLVFINPIKLAEVQCPTTLSIDEQRHLLKHWLSPECVPEESAMGMLCLYYGVSNEDIRNLKVREINFQNGLITIKNRASLVMTNDIYRVLKRYFIERDKTANGSKCEYFFLNRRLVTLNKPVGERSVAKILSAAEVNTRKLRSTYLIEIALSGNVKALEAVGLSLEGCKPYLNIVKCLINQIPSK
jgi:site-specific recombinase XerD